MQSIARRARPIPVFIISFNRGAFLSRAVDSIRRLSRPTEIIVQDNGSTDRATLEVLADLESSGITIVRRPAIDEPDDLNLVDDTVQEFFAARGDRSRYVVMDCDVDLGIADPQALDVYDELLDRFRNVECVGPMLRIRDIPREYPLYNHVTNWHIEQFWSHHPSWVQTSIGPVAYLEHTVDTSFALHRAGERFRRLKKALRVYEPYEALHLDWYRSEVGSDTYAQTSAPGISHWNSEAERELRGHVELKYDRYYTVRRTFSGSLEPFEERLQSE
ncbi:MAG TPA: glycosyltransferase family A protein [Candidatus Acidoferrales bacterium]|jgi:glycosyltransferase involved in cell wall biosynthesis|nr:glycosyltransferase family A protein [Candidatus Acidoferrales bacterium]